MEERALESAEEVLARLERYVATRRARSSLTTMPEPTAATPPAVLHEESVAVDTLIPARVLPRAVEPARRPGFAAEVAPALVAVGVCSFFIMVWKWLALAVAVGVGAALFVAGLIGLMRRVPLARAYAFGLVVAVLLIRFS